MKKKTTLTALVLIFSFNSFSQPAIQWQKCFGGTKIDRAFSIQQTLDGGYVVVGGSVSNDGDVTGHHPPNDSLSDYWVVKLNSNGVIQWQKSLGGTGDDVANSVQQTFDGGYIVAGVSYSNDGDVTGNHGMFLYYDFWLVKLDGNGNLQWQKCLGGTDNERARSAWQTSDGGYIIAGDSRSNDGDVSGNHGDYDYWIVKLNSAGAIQWQKSLGGTGVDIAYSVQQTSDGGYIAAGGSNSNNGDVNGNHGNYYYWAVKLNSTGAIQWQKCFGGTSSESARSIQQTSDGEYVVTGLTHSNDGDVSGNHGLSDYWVAKLDTGGGLQWQKCFGGTASEEANSIQQTSDGGYIIAGSSFGSNNGDVTGNHGLSDYWIVKVDNSGIIQWQKCMGGTSYEMGAWSIQQTSDGGFITAGGAISNNGDVSGNHGNYDYWIVKLAPYVGIEENGFHSEINIYPNPAGNELRIENSEFRIKEVEIYDVVGRERLTLALSRGEGATSIDVSALAAGIYFVRAQTKEGTMTAKFVKK